MDTSLDPYYKLISLSIIIKNEFNIAETHDFNCLLNSPFHKDEYSRVISILKSHDWENISQLQCNYDYADEFLIIESFRDQNKNLELGRMFVNFIILG